MPQTPTAAAKRQALATQIRDARFVTAPGIFDMISARMADRMGFDCLYMTGFGTVASLLGLPDAGIATFSQMVERVARFADGTTTPIVADADTGYGGLLNVAYAVRGYEAAGAAGIQIEDQEFPKKCGHTPGRRVIPLADMVRKIEVAVDARSDANMLIVARTDARTTLGLDEALRRAEAYRRAGADILFVESPESEAEMEAIGRRIDAPLLANLVEGGRTPMLTPQRLDEIGYGMAIYPGSGFLATAAALDGIYGAIKATGTTNGAATPIYPFSEMTRLMGFEEVWAFERRWAE
ncbi:2-methylisocitrate lyase-like PEP mutase family enzyme [Stella humosa]|uniref:2-methylisocitrate lyase-like PEP mutase family enzyme n=1 Tax=Stella humosa TaxID=94 RepID=A0A3N1KY04_9PROT|nr:isocitrate lyase/PEP mutase family protein [Stella humosa]ROP84312.1 2-methylisocitrate lyase-like PEP mutase family enzyme [Stella humosa]BBK33826.1 carboxyvinyl-carboxyphosphonate phosphorylmutase [Stella humosa]